MTQMLTMPRVQTCSVTECGYNQGGCTAFAITIGTMSTAECETFIDTGETGGMGAALAQVGACKRADCTFNQELECRAPAITVGASADRANCLTYQQG